MGCDFGSGADFEHLGIHPEGQKGCVMGSSKEKNSSQAAPELLSEMREMARSEGRQFRAVMEEAMQEYVESRARLTPGPEVMDHFQASVERNRRLYELLAQ